MADAPGRGESAAELGIHAPAAPYRAFRAGIVLTAVALVLALWAAVLAFAWYQRGEALREAQRDAVNLSLIFNEQVVRTLTAIDQTMRFLDADMRRAGDGFDLGEWAKSAPVVTGFVNQVSIIGADGRLKATSTNPHPPPVDLSDREHFRVHLQDDGGVLYVSEPTFGRYGARWAIRVTRRISAHDGSFAGVLVFSLDPDFLTRLSGVPGLGRDVIVSVVGRDGVVRASYGTPAPGPGFLAVRSMRGSQLFAAMSSSDEGTVIVDSPFRGIRRIFAYHAVPGYPLIVLVGISLAEVFANAEAASHLIFVATAAAAMVLAVLFAYLFVEIERRAARERELAEKRVKLEAVNRDLLVSRDEAQAASRAKSEFLATTSHELRTPLNAIIGFSEIMRDQILGPLGNPQYQEYAVHIYDSGRSLLALINDILDLSRAEAGALELRPDLLDVEKLVAASISRAEPEAKLSGVTLAAEMLDPPRTIFADEAKLRRVCANLLSNAIKFSRRGGRIVLRAKAAPDGGIFLVVEDGGIGMTPEEVALALEPFRQVDSKLARKFSGSGLGLPLAKRLVELHAGTIAIESARDRGTRVTVFLPQKRQAQSAA